MKQIQAKPLTPADFAKYGSYCNLYHRGDWPAMPDPFGGTFVRDMLVGQIGTTGSIAVSVTHVKKRPLVITFIEKHCHTCEIMTILDADVLMHFGIATPAGEYPLDQLEVFRIPKGTCLCIRPGVWHEAPYLTDAEEANVQVLLPEYAYVNDFDGLELDESQQIAILP